MNLGTVVLLGLVATLAAALAILAGPDTTFAVPAAAIAVGAAALLLLGVLERTDWSSTGARSLPSAPTTRIRRAFEAGKHGRRELIAMLDSLERSGFGTGPPGHSAEELDHLLTETPGEFRRYLDARVSDLEGRT